VSNEACLGAAILAAKASGWFKNVEDATKSIVELREEFKPNLGNLRLYDELYAKYLKLNQSLQGLFDIS
jgi:xylulokinase